MGIGQKNLKRIKCFAVVILAFISLNSAIIVRAEVWNNIYPLKSTRGDVEKILGKCKDSKSLWNCLYKMKDQNVYISYSIGNSCEKGAVWNVPKGTVDEITIYLKNGGVILRNIKFDLKDFVEEEDSELIGRSQFINENKGISFEVEDGFVKTFHYSPTLEERKKFVCSKD
jgi:hypothetical protein